VREVELGLAPQEIGRLRQLRLARERPLDGRDDIVRERVAAGAAREAWVATLSRP